MTVEEFNQKDPFIMCKGCNRRSRKSQWESHFYACPVCGRLRNISAQYRFSMIFDGDGMKFMNRSVTSDDPLSFPGYKEKLKEAKEKTHMNETAAAAVGKISGIRTVAVVLDSRFFMGSMSQACGERITRAIEYATKHRLPLVIFSASGGARMQEGMFSLWQMAKTADAVEEFSRSGGLYISVLTHPTTGGVTASFATLGDITLAEPGALIGFAGPRVIEQTIGKKLPKGFQRAEYLYQHGFVDAIVKREDLKPTLTRLLMLHGYKAQGGKLW